MIEMGLLWYEPSRGVPLAERIDAAAERYLERFGEAPNVCLVSPSEVEAFDRIAVRGDKRIQPGYLLVGIERDEQLPEWTPQRRTSDEAEVALLAPDGRVICQLRPTPRRAVAAAKATVPAAQPRSSSHRASKSGASPSGPRPVKRRATRTITVISDSPASRRSGS